jgi:hypothetical protein
MLLLTLQSSPTKAVYVSMELDASGKCSWVSFINNLLPIRNENPSKVDIRPRQIVAKLKCRYVSSWKRSIDYHPNPLCGKLSTYRTINTNFCFEQYLSEVTIDTHTDSPWLYFDPAVGYRNGSVHQANNSPKRKGVSLG